VKGSRRRICSLTAFHTIFLDRVAFARRLALKCQLSQRLQYFWRNQGHTEENTLLHVQRGNAGTGVSIRSNIPFSTLSHQPRYHCQQSASKNFTIFWVCLSDVIRSDVSSYALYDINIVLISCEGYTHVIPAPVTPKSQSSIGRKLQDVENAIGSAIDQVTQPQTVGKLNFPNLIGAVLTL
jgi:hypothetical protein